MSIIDRLLQCEVKNVPCSYLGLLLLIKKPSKAKLQPLVHAVADHLLVRSHCYPMQLAIG